MDRLNDLLKTDETIDAAIERENETNTHSKLLIVSKMIVIVDSMRQVMMDFED